MNKLSVDDVLDFWFGKLDEQGRRGEGKSALWWGKNPQTDQLIESKFGQLRTDISAGGYSNWLESPRGRLASIIVLDQFSRNIYRDQPQAFAADPIALSFTLEGIATAADLALHPIQRAFFYMPLEHSEDMAIQEQSILQFKKLLDDVSEQDKQEYRGYLEFAQKHYDVIARHGRYPHRNRILGRQSTDAELAYLQLPGSGF